MERRLRANRGKNPNARWLVDDVATAKKRSASKVPKAPEPASEPAPVSGEVRCICNGSVPDTMIMTECESCNTWQHNKCAFGLNAEHVVPVPYICRWCRPQGNGLQLDAIVDLAAHKKARESAVEQWERLLTAQNHADPATEAAELERRLFDTYGSTPRYRAAFRHQISNY